MKNLKFNAARTALAFLLVTSFYACKESKKTPEPRGGVEGNWKLSAITVTPAYSGITDFLAYLVTLSGDDCIKRVTLTFKGNGTIDGSVPQGCETEDTGEVVSEGATWKVEGDKIILTDPDGAVESYRLETGGASMKWSYEEADEDEPAKKYTYTIVFSRAN